MLNRKRDYYHQVTSQIALTGAEFCDCHLNSRYLHIERIFFDATMWAEMKAILACTLLGVEVLDRLYAIECMVKLTCIYIILLVSPNNATIEYS